MSPAAGGGGSAATTMEMLQTLSHSEPARRSANSRLMQIAKTTGSAAAISNKTSQAHFDRTMQGRRGSLDEETGEENLAADRYIIRPDSTFRRYWDLSGVAFIFLNALAIPFWVAFITVEQPVAWTVLDALIDVFFVVDIALNFRTGFIDDGELIMDGKPIATNYAKGWLWVDIVATFPYNAVLPEPPSDLDGAGTAYYELPAMVRFVRMVRLVRLMRLFRLSSRLSNVVEMGAVSKTILRISKLAFWVTVIAHVSGCFWALIASIEDDPMSWTNVYEVDVDDVASVYLSGVYYSLATLTTVGYGDVSAHTNGERVFALLLMLVGAVVFAIVVGRMSALAQSMNRGSLLQQRVADDVQEMMRYRNLPRELRGRMRQYYSLHLEHKPFYDELGIMAELSPALRRDVVMFLNKDLIQKVPFLRDADQGFLSEISPLLKPVRAIPGDFIIIAGEVGRELYMLSEGEIEVISREGNIIRILGAGSFFGEIALLEGCRRTVSVRARTNCHMLTLSRDALNMHLKEFPSFAEGLRLVARARRYGKPDPDLAKLRRVKPPLGKASWADVLPKHSSFLDRARELAESVSTSSKESKWGKLRRHGTLGAAVTAAKADSPKTGKNGKGRGAFMEASATFGSKHKGSVTDGWDASTEVDRDGSDTTVTAPAQLDTGANVAGTDLSEVVIALRSVQTTVASGLAELSERLSDVEVRLRQLDGTSGPEPR